MIRLPGTEHLPLSPNIVTDGTFFESFSQEWLEKHPNAYDVAILVKDGRIFGGKDFMIDRKLYSSEKEKLKIFNGARFAIIPLDEIVGIRKGYIYA